MDVPKNCNQSVLEVICTSRLYNNRTIDIYHSPFINLLLSAYQGLDRGGIRLSRGLQSSFFLPTYSSSSCGIPRRFRLDAICYLHSGFWVYLGRPPKGRSNLWRCSDAWTTCAGSFKCGEAVTLPRVRLHIFKLDIQYDNYCNSFQSNHSIKHNWAFIWLYRINYCYICNELK